MAKLLGMIGLGNMESALMEGILSNSKLSKKFRIMGSDLDARKLERAKASFGIKVTRDNRALASQIDLLLLATKPQEMGKLLESIREELEEDVLILSIAAGITTQLIEKKLGFKARVIRVMPNTPALVGQGISVIARGRYAKRSDAKLAMEILSAVGEVVELPEKAIDAVTALSGSGPAYFAYWIESMVTQGIKEGLSKKVALQLALQTAKGTALLMEEEELEPLELIKRVASKKGTTEAALKVFEKEQVGKRIQKGVRAAAARSRELSKGQ